MFSAKIGKMARVKGYVGMSELRDLARVKIRIGSRVWDETVALISVSVLGGKVLLAINFKQKESWELLDWVRTQEFKVQAVETRAQCKVREYEEEKNEVVMLEEMLELVC